MPSYRGYVYLIGSSQFGWYKIGQSRTAAIRIKTLGILLPFKIEVFAVWKTDNPGRLEAAMHERHHEDHLNGEWFSFHWNKLLKVVEAETPYPAVKETGAIYGFSNIESNRTQNLPTGLLGGLHFGKWIDQYLLDSGLARTKGNVELARKEVYKLFTEKKVISKRVVSRKRRKESENDLLLPVPPETGPRTGGA